jgi:HEAT repeat protein
MRCRPSFLSLLLLTLPGAVMAQVDSRTASLSKQLGQGQEPRARTQAAQGLGSSDDPEAVKPLCSGLKDPEGQVRAAAAQALGKLKEVAGLECLKARKGETDAAAQGVLRKHGIHGFRVQAEIHSTESGGLMVRMVCIGYPDQALLGDVEVQASGAKPEELLKVLAPRIIEEAADTFEWDT